MSSTTCSPNCWCKKNASAANETDSFERFGIGEHLNHPSFDMGDVDFEGIGI